MKYIILFILFGVCLSCDQSVRPNNPQTQSIHDYLTFLESKGFSGTVLVAKEGNTLLKKGYGFANESKHLKVTPRTVFTIGSITKQFTGAAILKLEMLGKLSVSDSLDQYFIDVPNNKKGITIHHLLTHSAGFRGAIGDDFDPVTADDFVSLAMESELSFPPGSQYDYSNVGYSLLGIIIEKVSGMPYESYLNKVFFQVLGMNNTGYTIPDWGNDAFAHGYKNEKDWGTILDRPWAEDGPGWHLRANGGILSTPEDMYIWYLALRGNDILSPEAKEKYFARHIEEGEGAGTYYGYGWAIFPTPRGTDLITHNGGNGIFFADMLIYMKEDVMIFFATNRSHRKFNDVAFHIARKIFIPDFDMNELMVEETVLDDFPSTDKGQLVKQFIAIIQEGSEDIMMAFVNNNFSENFKKDISIEEHMDLFRRLKERIKAAEPSKIIQRGDKLEVIFSLEDMELIITPALNSELKIDGMDIMAG